MRNLMLTISMLLVDSGSPKLQGTAKKIGKILHDIVGPCLTVISSLAVIYIVVLGVQYAKSESDDKRAETKKRIVNLAIGAAVIIVLLVLCFAIKWDELIPSIFGGYYNSEYGTN